MGKNRLSEPSRRKIVCVYCADAPVNHRLHYVISALAVAFDTQMLKVTRRAPDFLRRFVDWLLNVFFEILLFLRLAKLSDDIELAKTFRSRVIWEEARKRGIEMKQYIMFGKPIDQYRTRLNGKVMYFDSLPIPSQLAAMHKSWDDKLILKKELSKHGVPVPVYRTLFVPFINDPEKIFRELATPFILKSRVGSRGRHTVTNIHTLDEFKAGLKVAGALSPFLVAEEHLTGDVCRATFVDGKLMGFYRGMAPFVIGDGMKTIGELVAEKDARRHERVEQVLINREMREHIMRLGFDVDTVLPAGLRLALTHRTGRFFGGMTEEMLDKLHPSFAPILGRAAEVVGMPVMGFDCIIPDPTEDASTQRWGIIECNTLPFIDLHYYALFGKPKNIAGAIWDLWERQ